MVRRRERTILSAASVLLVMGLVILNALAAVYLMAFDLGLYRSLWLAYGVPDTTGMTLDELSEAGQALLDYFEGKSETPQRTVLIDGVSRPLYNETELLHLADVKSLFRFGFTLQGVAAAEVVGISLFLWRAGRKRSLGTSLLSAAAVCLGLLAALAIPARLDFGTWWMDFHLITFSNDLWLLDPATDWLIRMFPEGFFLSAITRIGLYSAGISTAFAVLGFLIRHFSPDHRH